MEAGLQESIWLSWKRELALWFGVLGAPVAWALNLQIAYALAESVCKSHDATGVRASHLFFLCISLAALLVAAVAKRPKTDDEEFEERISRPRFMAVLGMLVSSLFSLIIVAQFVATLMVHPCAD